MDERDSNHQSSPAILTDFIQRQQTPQEEPCVVKPPQPTGFPASWLGPLFILPLSELRGQVEGALDLAQGREGVLSLATCCRVLACRLRESPADLDRFKQTYAKKLKSVGIEL